MFRERPAVHRGRGDRADHPDVRPLGLAAAQGAARPHLAPARGSLFGGGARPEAAAEKAREAGLHQPDPARLAGLPDRHHQGRPQDGDARVGEAAPLLQEISPASLPSFRDLRGTIVWEGHEIFPA